jgi:cobalt-zinc-cadmium efflux system membrane fusion protein
VHSKVAGFMKKVNFYSGEFVKKGTLLAIVENTEFVGKQREMLEFKTKVFYAEREYNRRKNLAEGDAIAKKEIQQAEADFQNLLTAYQGVKKELEVFGFNVDNIEQTGQLQTQLSIFAPQSGFITQVNTNLGKKVSPDDELYQIIDKTDIHIELEVFAIDVPKLKDNQSVVFNIPGSTQEFKATIHTIGSLIDEKTKTVNVHCHLQNESDAKYLTAGTGITAQVKVGVHSALCVAREALVKENEAYFIFVKKGDAFEKTKVEIGISNDDFVEIKNWDNKEDVITKGAYYVQ